MAQDTQYCSLRYILGTAYSGKTEASEISPRNRCQIVVHQFSFFFFHAETLGRSDFEDLRHTDCGRFDHVSDCESLYCLILWCASGAVGASNGLDVPSALLVATAVPCMLASSPQLDTSSGFIL